MGNPKYIRTPAEFEAIVKLGETQESEVIEFKSEIPNWNSTRGIQGGQELRGKAQKETCRDIAQFANSAGGCLIIGVSESARTADSSPRALAVQSVADAPGLVDWIKQAVTRFIIPTTFAWDAHPVTTSSGVVLALNVPASIDLVSLYDRQTHSVEYLRRTGDSKDWMNPDEAERHIMDGSRAVRLRVAMIVDAAPSPKVVQLAGGFWCRLAQGPDQRFNAAGQVRIVLHEHVFELTIPTGHATQSQMLPYGVVREIWLEADQRISLLLSVKLLVEQASGNVIVEPY